MEEVRQSQLVDRMIRGARLERTLYTEVSADVRASRQAVLVVVTAAVASAIAYFLSRLFSPLELFGASVAGSDVGTFSGDLVTDGLVVGLIVSPALSIIGWLAWSAVAWFVGTRMISTTAQDVEFMQVARAMGFAQAPGVMAIITFIPVLGFIIQIGIWLWLLATSFFATRESMRLTDGQALVTMTVGFIAFMIVVLIIGGVLVTSTAGSALIGPPTTT
jgi:hypothetical protein